MRVTPASTLPEQQSWCYTLWSQCSGADILVVLTGLGLQFALHSCSNQASFPIIPSSLPFSWLLRTSLVLWVLLLPPWLLFWECYVLTPLQGWTFQSCSVTGFHWAVFSSASTLPFLPQALNTIYVHNSPKLLSLTMTFPLDSRLVYSTAYWTGSLGSWPLSFFGYSAVRVSVSFLDFISLMN